MWKPIIFVLNIIIGCIFGQRVTELKTQKINFPLWPFWDDHKQSVYFANFSAGGQNTAIFRYNFNNGDLYSASIPGVESISFILPVRHDCTECEDIFAIGNEHGSNLIKWNGISAEAQLLGTQKLFNVEEFDPNSHINVAQADRTGRLFIGTFSEDFCNTPANHSLYRYTIERGIEPIFSGIYGSSGIAIDERANKLYHVDYSNTGDICNGRVVFDFKLIGQTFETMTPEGLAVDNNGYIYTADYRSFVYVIDPILGILIKVIDMGIQGVSGVAFGGPRRDILFVPAASLIINTKTGQPLETVTTGSSLYTVTGLGVTGRKQTLFNVPESCPNEGCYYAPFL